jgi:MFS transporter, ACS family, tartrate transporter
MAVALYSGRDPCHRPRDHHHLLLDGLARAGGLASSGRTQLARQRIASGGTSKKEDTKRHNAFCDLRILRLIVAYFLALTGALGTIYWIPTFVKRLSGFSIQTVTSLLLIPALMGIAGMLFNGWHSDRTAERRWHSAIPLVAASFMFGLLILFRHEVPLAIACLLLGSGFFYAFYPAFWAIPTTMLSETAAAATFGLINSIGQLGGLAGNYTIGYLNDRTHSLTASFAFIALVYVVASSLILSLRIRDPIRVL